MKIYYDGAIYTFQKAGGINRYFASIISRLPAGDTPVVSDTWFSETNLNLPSHPRLQYMKAPCGPIRPYRYFYKWNQSLFARQVERSNYDLVHPTYYYLISGQEFRQFKRPVVLTVYDMLHEKFGHLVGPNQEDIPERKRKAIEAASLILCISENTRRDLLEYYHVSEDKVRTTYLASELDESQIEEAEPVPERPFFLFVGSRTPYKNFSLTLNALHRLRTDFPEVVLCVVGPPATVQEQQQVTALGLTQVVQFVGQVKDGQLAKLYRDSLALVYPSLYEGFGIPPLEAMACGGIAIAANCSSLPEVVGNAGLLFNPEDPDGLYNLLHQVAQGQIDRGDLVRRGKQQSETFSWDKTAQQTYRAYESVL